MTYHNAHAALLDEQNFVREIIVIPFLDDDDAKITEYCNAIGLPGTWLDCSYLGSRRGKYPSIGDRYDSENDIFVSPVSQDSE
jgi:hypothetical protein